MRKLAVLAVLAIFGLSFFWGCSSMRTWPDSERSVENKMTAIQGRIGDGLKTGALTPDQSQSFLTKLKVIQTDYVALKDKPTDKNKWDMLLGRLDALDTDVSKAYDSRRIENPRSTERIAELQRRIDDGRINRRLPQTEASEFQARLDAIRRDYSRITERGRSVTTEESDDIYRRLDLLEMDLNRFR